MLPLSIAAITGLAAYFGITALQASQPSAAVEAGLLCCLSLLAALEHLFLALPFRDSTLWGWAMGKQTKTGI
jgi:hypothetical protein